MSQCLREITNTYPPIEVPKAPNLSCFANLKVLGASSQDMQGHHSASKVSDVNTNGGKENAGDVKAQTFEERLAQLDTPSTAIGNKVNIDILNQIQEMKQVNANTMIQVESLMQQTIKDFHLLQLRVEDLEVEAMDMQKELDSAHHKIKTHERLIRQAVGPAEVDFQQEYQYDSTGTDEPSHDAISQPNPESSI